MKTTKQQQGAALATAPKNPTAATTAGGRELTPEEAAALGLDHSERYTYYFFEKKGGRR